MEEFTKWRNYMDSIDYFNHRLRCDYPTKVVDTECPQTYLHSYINLKRLRAEELEKNEIDRLNHMLTNNILRIMVSKSSLDNYHDPGLGRNIYKIKAEGKTRKLHQILLENQAILKRIVTVKSTYPLKKWEQEYYYRKQKKPTNFSKKYPAWNQIGVMKSMAKSRLYIPDKAIKRPMEYPSIIYKRIHNADFCCHPTRRNKAQKNFKLKQEIKAAEKLENKTKVERTPVPSGRAYIQSEDETVEKMMQSEASKELPTKKKAKSKHRQKMDSKVNKNKDRTIPFVNKTTVSGKQTKKQVPGLVKLEKNCKNNSLKANVRISADKKFNKKVNAEKKLTNKSNSPKKENKNLSEAFQQPSKIKSRIFMQRKSSISNESLKKVNHNAFNQCLGMKASSVSSKSNKVVLTSLNKLGSLPAKLTKSNPEVNDQVLIPTIEDKDIQKLKKSNTPKKKCRKSLVLDPKPKLSSFDQLSELFKNENSNVIDSDNSNLSLSSSKDFLSSASISFDSFSSEISSKMSKMVIETKNNNQTNPKKSSVLKQTLNHKQVVPQIGSIVSGSNFNKIINTRRSIT